MYIYNQIYMHVYINANIYACIHIYTHMHVYKNVGWSELLNMEKALGPFWWEKFGQRSSAFLHEGSSNWNSQKVTLTLTPYPGGIRTIVAERDEPLERSFYQNQRLWAARYALIFQPLLGLPFRGISLEATYPGCVRMVRGTAPYSGK